MSNAPTASSNPSDRELVLTRIINAPPAEVYEAWTNPEIVVKWFAPKPWSTSSAQLDVRAGGDSVVTMRSPEGVDYPNRGVYLEVVPNKKLVFTDAFTKAWEPSEKPFMTGILTFEEAGPGKTKYTARVVHWSVADREAHEQMGFHTGWGQCADQLDALLNGRPF